MLVCVCLHLSLPLQKRIRDLSSLEKIYEYFATREQSGRKVMCAQDVVRALVPTYPPVGSNVERAGFLDGEHSVLQAGLTGGCVGGNLTSWQHLAMHT